jgi:hypothetical protein
VNLGRGLRRSGHGGAVLDSIVGLGIVLIGAFLLYHLGLTFQEILHGAAGFFGI